METKCTGGKVFSSCVPSCQKTCTSKFADQTCLVDNQECNSGEILHFYSEMNLSLLQQIIEWKYIIFTVIGKLNNFNS